MKMQVHGGIGVVGGVLVYLGTKNLAQSIGWFFGSWIIDLDHLWQYWVFTWRKRSLKQLLDPREMLKYNDMLTDRAFNQGIWLHLLFMHTIEFLAILYFIMITVQNVFYEDMLLAGLLAIVLHLYLDDYDIGRNTGWGFLKRAHSVIEFYIRKYGFREKVYQDLYED